MPIIFTRAGHVVGASSTTEVLAALSQTVAKLVLGNTGSLVDNSGGTSVTALDAASAVPLANHTGSNLAKASDVEARFGEVRDALRELAAKANEIATRLGIPTLTWNGGGAAPNGVVDAIGSTIAAQSSGAAAAQVNAALAALDRGLFTIARFVNRICVAVGEGELVLGEGAAAFAFQSPVPPIAITVGADGSPAVRVADVQAKLTILRNNVRTIVSKINGIIMHPVYAPVTVI